jgi:hypothetical protein
MLPARMRSICGWSDACILNVSSRGLLIYSSGNAKPGSFVEIRRGGQLVVARVVWRKNRRIGLCSSDPVRVEDIISSETAASAVQSGPHQRYVERRRVPRDSDRSRERGRAIEFLSLVVACTAAAGLAAVYVEQTLEAPLAAVKGTLSPH